MLKAVAMPPYLIVLLTISSMARFAAKITSREARLVSRNSVVAAATPKFVQVITYFKGESGHD